MNNNLHMRFVGERHENETYEEWLEKSLMDARMEAMDAKQSLAIANRDLEQANESLIEFHTKLDTLQIELEKSRLRNLASVALAGTGSEIDVSEANRHAAEIAAHLRGRIAELEGK